MIDLKLSNWKSILQDIYCPVIGSIWVAIENGRYPPTQNGDIRSLFKLFTLMAMQN